jgi:hypothetical protein
LSLTCESSLVLFFAADHNPGVKPLLTLLILLGFCFHSRAEIPLAQGRKIQKLNSISTRTLQRAINPKFYRSLCISPIQGLVVVRATLANTRLLGARIIHSELDGRFDELALKLTKDQEIAGYYGSPRPGMGAPVLINLLVYQIADGTMVLAFPTFEEPGGDQIRTWGCAKLLVHKDDGTWTEIEGPEGLQGKGWALRMPNRHLNITGFGLK